MGGVLGAVASSPDNPDHVEVRLLTADGEWRWFDARVTDLRGTTPMWAGSSPTSTTSTIANAPKRPCRRPRSASAPPSRTPPIGMGLVDRDGRWIRANRALARLLAHSQVELLGASVSNVTHSGDRAARPSPSTNACSPASPTATSSRSATSAPTGRRCWWRCRGRRVRGEEGALRYVIEEMQDITERRRAEEALARPARSTSACSRVQSPAHVGVRAGSLRFLEVNQAAITHYGYSRAEFLAMSIADIRPATDHDALWQSATEPRPTLERSGTWRHLRKDGKTIEVEIASHLLRFADEDAVLVAVVDVTERNTMEAQLRELAERGQADRSGQPGAHAPAHPRGDRPRPGDRFHVGRHRGRPGRLRGDQRRLRA